MKGSSRWGAVGAALSHMAAAGMAVTGLAVAAGGCSPGARGREQSADAAQDLAAPQNDVAARDSNGGAQPGLDVSPGPPFMKDMSDPSAPGDASGAFGGGASSDPAARPTLVYPLDASMLGRNIGGMNIQWKAGAGTSLYRVRVKGDTVDAKIYAGAAACPGGKCQVPVPDDFWLGIASAGAGASVTIAVDAVAAAGGDVSSSDTRTVSFAPDDIKGGLYYWSTTLQGLMRVRFGDSKPEPFLTPQTQNGLPLCAGCHAVTRDGCRVAFRYAAPDNGNKGTLGITDGRDATNFFNDPKATNSFFQTWNPEGTRLLTGYLGQMTLRDQNGKKIADVPRNLVGATEPSHPDWAPDGSRVVMTRRSANAEFVNEGYVSGDIIVMPFANDAFGKATVLVPQKGSEFHYYPHFSPDSQWVVFNSAVLPDLSASTHPQDGLSPEDQPTARLRLVSAAGGTPVELTQATQGKGVTASLPVFSPFSQRAGQLLFVVFSSKISYGWVVDQAALAAGQTGFRGRPQLWVAAIDLSRPGDPSYAPFWLPFQLPSDGNHLAYWTTRIVGGTVGGKDCN